MKRFCLFLLVCLCCFSLLGCSDKSLLKEEEVVELFEEIVPNAEFVSVRHDDSVGEFGRNMYVFDTGEFSFEVENYMYSDSIFNINSNRMSNSYLIELIKYKYGDIKGIADKYGIYLICQAMEESKYTTREEIYELMKLNPTYCMFNVDLNQTNMRGVGFYGDIYLNDFSQIDRAYGFLEDVYELLEDYFPKEEHKDLKYSFGYDIYPRDLMLDKGNSYGYSVFEIGHSLLSEGEGLELEKEWVKHRYAYQVRIKNVVDSNLSYEDALKYCPPLLNRLVIDGVEVELSDDFKFYYNIEEKRYYSRIYCGDEELDEGKGEHTQKLLIEKYYPDCKYESNSKERYTRYTINGNDYEISRKSYTSDLEFERNGRNLGIEGKDTLPYQGVVNSSVFQYITIEEFALLLGMKTEKIDITNGILYMVSE